ncbi:oxygen-dependent tRNA uridine(34) hydroxylase TrhO [Legionella spiritensis]|uniref:tRNA uridine(34) hydroxylase n=1 Tax=Legionella spiritensis TaxID=452 RepID=A0A0W0Z5X7_LEGSP|nr:rhodanese-related sulfurtransferase [Legionella spiritensis]KTD64530.1 sulfur transferase [Legionella spiritensis]SNV29925.1 rhodanese domain protein [Legionella spiritensis]VEG91834.1 rhodanese domain protein [Legionella spiritensis]
MNQSEKKTNPYIVASFYKFTPLPDYELLRQPLLDGMIQCHIKGTLILASEGINGSFCGTRENIDRYKALLGNVQPAFSNIRFIENDNDSNPFDKSKVKLRKEIVSMGVEGVDTVENTGVHVKPEEWNKLISEEDVLVIDTRNDYEIELGTFKGATNPKTINFRDFPEYVRTHLMGEKTKKIAMCCTGGVRCEKSTAYLKQLGFENVYQLDGGILSYLESMPEEQSLWVGSCFVFDNRVAVDNQLNRLSSGTVDLEWKNKFRVKQFDDNSM